MQCWWQYPRVWWMLNDLGEWRWWNDNDRWMWNDLGEWWWKILVNEGNRSWRITLQRWMILWMVSRDLGEWWWMASWHSWHLDMIDMMTQFTSWHHDTVNIMTSWHSSHHDTVHITTLCHHGTVHIMTVMTQFTSWHHDTVHIMTQMTSWQNDTIHIVTLSRVDSLLSQHCVLLFVMTQFRPHQVTLRLQIAYVARDLRQLLLLLWHIARQLAHLVQHALVLTHRHVVSENVSKQKLTSDWQSSRTSQWARNCQSNGHTSTFA